MTFLHPVYVGQLVTVKATVNAAWRTSMEVGVRVEAENIRTGEIVHTSTAYLTMVALDDEGTPTQVPPLAPETPDETSAARARHSCAATTAWPSAQRIEEEPGYTSGLAGSGSWRHSVNLPFRIV